MQKKAFLAMTANVNAIAKSSVWKDPNTVREYLQYMSLHILKAKGETSRNQTKHSSWKLEVSQLGSTSTDIRTIIVTA